MRRPRRVNVRTAVALAAVALVAAGCGLTDGGAQPGVAAAVDGETLELSQVDQAVQDYCDLLTANEQFAPVPTALVRGQFAQGWTRAIAIDHLAAELDVPLPPESIDRATVENLWMELGEVDDDNYDSFEWLTWVQLRLASTAEQLGARTVLQETGQTVSGEQAINVGVGLADEWLADHEPELNPVFGEYNPETGYFDGDSLSVPVSREAGSVVDTSALTAEQVNALPEDQRCGPVQAPQAPGA
ncbi:MULTISPECIES: hypothetical protein [unclassified Nocardioides]|uniref:hypothetical protein n=1 Tax=unclassified Nocardioides TaxID=2615069 RepID=UPI000A7335D1|nr:MULTISPECIES: hypothetical protein [unclassified Nocardioides]